MGELALLASKFHCTQLFIIIASINAKRIPFFGFLSINLYRITAKEEGLPIWLASAFAASAFIAGLLLWRWMLRR
jgi:hypothetical protein